MGDALAKFLRFSPLDIHMMWIEVAGLSRVQHDVSFGDGAPQCLALITQLVVFKISLLEHSSIPAFSNVVKCIYNTFVLASSQKVSPVCRPELPTPQANFRSDEATTGTPVTRREASA